MNRNLMAAAGLLAVSIALPHSAAAKPHKKASHMESVTVNHIAFHGWKDAYRVSNGVVDLVIVPAIGRVIDYQLTGDPESSPLWINPKVEGQLPDPNPSVFLQWGGSHLWPSPQDNWPSHQGNGWPPEPAIAYGPYVLTRIPHGVRLTGPESPHYKVRATREITLAPRSSQVTLKGIFDKSKSASGDKDGFPIGIWADLQVRGDATVYFPLDPHSRFGAVGYTMLNNSQPPPPPYWSSFDGLLILKRYPKASAKLGLDDTAGWMAAVYAGDKLFTEHFQHTNGTYPDKDTNGQFYNNADPDPYMEMEAQGPLANLKAGQRMTETITWNLQRLPRVPADGTDERTLVKQYAP